MRLDRLTFDGATIWDRCAAAAWRGHAAQIAAVTAGSWAPPTPWVLAGQQCCTCNDCTPPDAAWPTDPNGDDRPPWADGSTASLTAWGVWTVAWEHTSPILDPEEGCAAAWRWEVDLVGDAAGRRHLLSWLSGALGVDCGDCAGGPADLEIVTDCTAPAVLRGARVSTMRRLPDADTACTERVEVLFEAPDPRLWLPAEVVAVVEPDDWTDVDCSPLSPLGPSDCTCPDGPCDTTAVAWGTGAGGCRATPGEGDDSPLTAVIDAPGRVARWDLCGALGLTAPLSAMQVVSASAGVIRRTPDGITWEADGTTRSYRGVVEVVDRDGVQCTAAVAMLHRIDPTTVDRTFDPAAQPISRQVPPRPLPPVDVDPPLPEIPHNLELDSAGAAPSVNLYRSPRPGRYTAWLDRTSPALIGLGGAGAWNGELTIADGAPTSGAFRIYAPSAAAAWTIGVTGSASTTATTYPDRAEVLWSGAPGDNVVITVAATHDGSSTPLGSVTMLVHAPTAEPGDQTITAPGANLAASGGDPSTAILPGPDSFDSRVADIDHPLRAVVDRASGPDPIAPGDPVTWYVGLYLPEGGDVFAGGDGEVRVGVPAHVVDATIIDSLPLSPAGWTLDAGYWRPAGPIVPLSAPSTVILTVDGRHDGSAAPPGVVDVHVTSPELPSPVTASATGPTLIDAAPHAVTVEAHLSPLRSWSRPGESHPGVVWQGRVLSRTPQPPGWQVGGPVPDRTTSCTVRIWRPDGVASWTTDVLAITGDSSVGAPTDWGRYVDWPVTLGPGQLLTGVAVDVRDVVHDGSTTPLGPLTIEARGVDLTTPASDTAPPPAMIDTGGATAQVVATLADDRHTIGRGETLTGTVWSVFVAAEPGRDINGGLLRIPRPTGVSDWTWDVTTAGGASWALAGPIDSVPELRLSVDVPGEPNAWLRVDLADVEHSGVASATGALTAELGPEYVSTLRAVVTDTAPGLQLDPLRSPRAWWEDQTVYHATVAVVDGVAWWTWPDARGTVTASATGGTVSVVGHGIQWSPTGGVDTAAVTLRDQSGRHAVVVVTPGAEAAALPGCGVMVRPPTPTLGPCASTWCEPLAASHATIVLPDLGGPWRPTIRVTGGGAPTDLGLWWWPDRDDCTVTLCGARSTPLSVPASAVVSTGPDSTIDAAGCVTAGALRDLCAGAGGCLVLSRRVGSPAPATVELLAERWAR